MDDLYALEGGGSATAWQRKHAARRRAKLALQHRAEARAAKKTALREAKVDLKKRRAKWLVGWKKKAASAKAAGRPKPGKKGQPWRLATMTNPQVVDMIGRVFGRLTVIRSAPLSLTMKTSQSCRVWVVKCSCGSPERYVNGTSLRQGNSRSCGCLVVEAMRANGARRRAKRERLEASPLSVRVAELRHRILTKGRVKRSDGKLLAALQKLAVQQEIQTGVRRVWAGRARLAKPAGVRKTKRTAATNV